MSDHIAALDRDELFPDVRVRVSTFRHTVLSSLTSGRVESVSVRDGDRFSEDQVLVEIDPVFELVQLDRAKAARTRQELLCRMTEELVELGSKGDLELDLAKAELAQAEAEVRFNEVRLERTKVRAPFAGRVADMLVRESQYVSEGQPVLEILDDSVLELEFIVSSQWLRWFAPGYRFSVVIDETGRSHQAELERISAKVDPLSKSVKVYAKLLDPTPDLMEGMSGEALITPPAEAGS